jgi:hypothetical protein
MPLLAELGEHGSDAEGLIICALWAVLVAVLIWGVCGLWLKQAWAPLVAAIAFVVVLALCVL